MNDKGYLTDKNGNVLDQNGNVVLPKHLLGNDGEIPKVFREGLN